MKYIIVGLGNFGSSLALKLTEEGHEVIGVDNNENHVNEHKNKLTHTLKMDSAHELAISQLPLSDTDAIIVSIGEASGAAITTVALFKKHAPKCRIVARYTSEIQKTILEAMGIQELVNPEAEFAENFAHRLTITGSLNTYLLDDNYELLEFKLPKSYEGKSVQEVDIVQQWKVSLITLIRHSKKKNLLGREIDRTEVQGVISGSTKFTTGDTLLLFGKIKDLKNMMSHFQENER